MRRPAGSAWVGLALLSAACTGELVSSRLRPPPGVTPGTTPVLAIRIGGTDADKITAEALDPSGNVYVAGTFTGSAQFNPAGATNALISLGGTDGFVAKYSPTGALAWAVRFGGTGAETVTALARDNAGNLYVGGGFEGTANFGTGAGAPALFSAGAEDGFVAKLSGDGSFIWARRFGATSADEVEDLALDPAGDAYAVGVFSGRADALPATGGEVLGNGSETDGFVLSLDPSGAVRWAFGVGGTDADHADAVRVTSGSEVVVAGVFRGTADFAPGTATSGLVSVGGGDVFVAAYSTAGALLWARGIGGPGAEDVSPGGLAAEGSGGVALTGTFGGSVDFDPGAGLATRTSIGASDAYVVRLDGAGAYQSAFSVGGTGSARATHLTFASDGNVIAAGAFSGTVDFDPGSGTRALTALGAGGSDVFVAKYTPAGALVWLSRFGDAVNGAGKLNRATTVAADAFGAVYVAGKFFSTPNFDPGSGNFRLTSLGDADGFLVKLTSEGLLALP